MDFGIDMLAHTERSLEYARLAEECGFTHVFVGESQMMGADPFISLALMSQVTRRVKLGTNIAIAGNRLAPVTANTLGTLNKLAPGRLVFAVGVGNSARVVMGMRPFSLRELRDHVTVVRGLLSGAEVEYTEGGKTRVVHFYHQQFGFWNTRDRVPIIIAASAPKALELAGEIGDGIVTHRTNNPEGWKELWRSVCAGAERAGRDPNQLYKMLTMARMCLLGPGETIESPRVREEIGPYAIIALHQMYETLKQVDQAPRPLQPLFASYRKWVEQRFPRDRYYELHEGHNLYVRPEEEQFVTPELIRYFAIAARPEEFIERLHALEEVGVDHVCFSGDFERMGEVIRDFGEKVIARY